jgi:HD-GYP domain-containing protein (c-di-GMP phosphodiesterase class II)
MDVYQALIDIGIKLSSEQNLEILLELILKNARNITNADAGSLYLKEGNKLRFVISQNNTLEIKMGKDEFKRMLNPHSIPLSNKSIAGCSAKNKELLNIKDVYKIKNAPYCHDEKVDKKTGYKCQSMLTVPMLDRENSLVGIFQLINKMGPQKIIQFTKQDEELTEALSSQAAVAIRNAQLTEELKSAHLQTIYMLGQAAEYKDEETGNHIKRVSEFSKAIAESLEMDDLFIETIYYASPLHDVGKIGIPDNILTKQSNLTKKEWKIMKNHTVLGYELLKDSPSSIIRVASEVAYTHHERWDGKGYPRGLSGERIPITGRIVALADFFDAVTSTRPYRKNPFPMPKTLQIIREDRKKHFCPRITDAFFNIINKIKDIHFSLFDK